MSIFTCKTIPAKKIIIDLQFKTKLQKNDCPNSQLLTKWERVQWTFCHSSPKETFVLQFAEVVVSQRNAAV
jgi:hypothetical protein